MLTAILLAQWRSMRTFRLSAQPATALFSSITGLLFYGFWAGVSFGAYAFFADPDNAKLFSLALTGGLLLMFLYWQLTPVITASMGASLDLKKLLVYPIPREKLFLVEVLLRFTTCAEMLIVLFGVVAGLARYGLPVFLTAALFAAFNLLLSAGVRNLLERILLRKRIREVMMFLLVMLGVLPQILISRGFAFQNKTPEILWRPGLAIAILTALTAFAYSFSRWQFERSLHFEPETSSPSPAGSRAFSSRLYTLPSRFLPDPTAAIMEKELRSLLRTPPFRLILIMGCCFGLVLWLPHVFRKASTHPTFMAENAVTFATLYGILMLGQVSYFNCFGFERSAVQFWFSTPVPIVRTLVAKNLTALVFVSFEIVLVTLGALIFRMQVTPLKFLESVCVALLAAVYLISIGNISSVRVPRLLNAEKINQGGSSKAMNALLLLCFPVVLLPIALAYWARSVFESELVFFLLLALAAIFGGILYWVALTSAAATANQRREKILSDLSRGDGPLSIG
jgi:ABC-2 type transport system permease protein